MIELLLLVPCITNIKKMMKLASHTHNYRVQNYEKKEIQLI